MNYNDRIVDYIDRNLPENEEAELFGELSANAELRKYFSDLLMIKDTINRTSNLHAPSASMGESVFAQLGIEHQPILTRQIGRWRGLWASRLNTVLLSTLILLFTSWIFINAENRQSSATIPQDNFALAAESQEGAAQQEFINASSGKPIGLSKLRRNIEMTGTRHELPYQHSDLEKPDEPCPVALCESNQFQMNPSKGKQSTPNILKIAPNPSELHQSILPVELSIVPKQNSFGMQMYDMLSGFDFEYRNSTYWHLPRETISPKNTALFSNCEVSLAYRLNESLSLGFGASQETYSLKYTSEEDGELFEYRRQPNFTTFFAFLRSSIFSVGSYTAYARIGLGANAGGGVAKPALGVEFKAFEHIALTASVEYSRFWFRHQSTTFTSDKLGLNYGIILRP